MKWTDRVSKRSLGGGLTLLLVLLSNINVLAQTCVQPPPGIIAWWPLDETSGTTAEDIAGNNPGIHVNGPIPASGQVDGALRFDGGNDYVGVGDSDLWAFGSNDFTIELWANFEAPGGGTISSPGDIFIGSNDGPGTQNKWFFALGGGVLNFHINGPGSGSFFLAQAPFSPTVGQWRHLAITRSGANYTIFVDGSPVGSETNPVAVPDASAPLTIGQAESLGFMNGLLDEVTIYNRALTQQELQAITNAGSGGKCKHILDHFLSYKTKVTKGTPQFEPRSVSLADQFEEGVFKVTKSVSLANPADKNGEGINDPDTHLEGYQIAKGPKHVSRTVKVNNQFGELQITTLKADRLFVPTAKSLTGPVEPPNPDSHGVDHFKCYKVKVTKGAPKFPKGIQATVSDQFTDPPKGFDLKKPTRLCTPVDKEGEGIKNPDAHLLCYQAKPAKGQAKHQKRLGIFVNNQFGPGQVDTVTEEELCLPSTKTVLGASLDTDPDDAEREEDE